MIPALADRFRESMRRTASGVAILTTDGARGRAGVTVSTLCSLSMEPPSVIACVHRDNRALDTILISREFTRDDDERRRAERVGKLIEDVLSGRSWLPQIIQQRTKPKRGAKTFRIEPRAELRNALSNRFSVIEVEGLDRPGLLSEITGAISDLSLDIASAHITTFGEKVIDTFYVTDLTGAKIENPTRQEAVRKRLIASLEGAPTERTARTKAAAE